MSNNNKHQAQLKSVDSHILCDDVKEFVEEEDKIEEVNNEVL